MSVTGVASDQETTMKDSDFIGKPISRDRMEKADFDFQDICDSGH
jgi:hypothetical protein